MEEVDVALLKGRCAMQPSQPSSPIEDSWLAPRGRGICTGGQRQRQRRGGSGGGGGGSGGRDIKKKRDIAEDERRKRIRRGRAEGDERGAKGSDGRIASSGGAERKYENGVKEKKPGCRANYREKRGGTRGAAPCCGEEVAPWLRGGTRSLTAEDTTTTTSTRWKKRMEAPGGEEEWRHGNSGLVFDVPYGVTAGGYPREAGAQSGIQREGSANASASARARTCV